MLPSIILLLLGVVNCEVIQYIDPHDMDVKNLHKMKLSLSSSSLLTENISKRTENLQCLSDLYYRRTVRLLLQNVYIAENYDDNNNNNNDYYSGYINVNLNREDLEFLQIFSSENHENSHNRDDFIHVQSILENSIQKPTIQQYYNVVLTIKERIKLLIFNPTTLLVVILIICFIICCQLYYDKWAFFKFIAIVMYAIDYVLRYLQLIQAAEIEQMVIIKQHGHVPPECDPNKMEWKEYFKQKIRGLFYEDNCREFYKASYQNLNYVITPLSVVANQLDVVIVEPLNHLGNGIGKFLNSLIGSLPIGYSFILTPILILLIFFFLVISLLFITNKSLELNFFCFQFKLGVAQPKFVQQQENQRFEQQEQLIRRALKAKNNKMISFKTRRIRN